MCGKTRFRDGSLALRESQRSIGSNGFGAAAKRIYHKFGFRPLTLRVLGEIHLTAGFLQQPDAQCFNAARATVIFLEDAIQWKDTWWWHQQQCMWPILAPARSHEWRHTGYFGNRGKVWDGPLVHCYGYEWHLEAKKKTWSSTFKEFAVQAFRYAQSTLPATLIPEIEKPAEFRKKLKGEAEEELPSWRVGSREPAVEIIGDSELVISWLNGTSLPKARN